MAKEMYKYVPRWVEWCNACGHGFKVDAEEVRVNSSTSKIGFIGKILRRKSKVINENIKPKPSSCPVCGKVDNVTVIKLQEDKVAISGDI